MSSPSPTSPRRPDLPDSAPKKRRKGATRLSCAECRRLKLRCDRVVPCSSCVKRGCAAICPDGSLTTGQGNRFVLASTTELHEKILQLANRVRQLEDGLRSTHSQISHEPHPLLADDLLKIKAPLQREPPTTRGAPSIKEEEGNPPLVDAFGALSIDISGGTSYFGHVASSAYFLQMEDVDENLDHEMFELQQLLPIEILDQSAAFPIAHGPSILQNRREQLKKLYWYLPPSDMVIKLRTTYYSNAAWMYNPISCAVFDEQIYTQFYGSNTPPVDESPVVCHRLSVLFMILAIGCLMDLELPAYGVEAERFFHLARASLFQHSLVDDPTTNAVQALFLMSFYLFLGDRHGSKSGGRWTIMGIAVKMAQSIGLHRDNSRWNVDPSEAQRRRELFWELYTYDSWQCMTFGRPPSFSLAHMDCRMPYPPDVSDDLIFYSWKHRFTSQCMSVLHDDAFGAKVPTYATILQLDRKMRNYPVPPVLHVAGFGNSEKRNGGYPETVPLIMQRHIVLGIRETNLLYLHRSFFAKAISDHPKDPLGSPYGSSVIAAYRSAGSLVALQRNLHAQLPDLNPRIYFLHAHLFSCAIILGSIVCRCPSMSFAPSALVQLDSACELFGFAVKGFRAEKVLNIMLRLKEKAHASLDAFRHSRGSPPRSGPVSEPPTPVDGEDELATLGGMTRLVKKDGTGSNPSSPSTGFIDPSVVPLKWSPRMEHVHQNVREYLTQFPPTSAPYNESSMYSSPTYDSSHMKAEQHASTNATASSSHSPQAYQYPTNTFPAYFPVYDYTSQQSMASVDGQYAMMDTDGSRAGPVEESMQKTWNDFVSDFGTV